MEIIFGTCDLLPDIRLVGFMQSCGISVVHVAESGVHLVYQTECILHKGHEPLVILQVHHGGVLQLPECAYLVLSILALVQGPLPTLVQLGSTEAAVFKFEAL